MKKKIKLKKWVKVVILILVILVASILTTTHHRKTTIKNNATKVESKNKKQIIKSKNTIKMKAEEPVQEENAQNNEEIVQNTEETHNEVQNTMQNQAEQSSTEQTTYETRMTSYYPEETSNCTGSGLCISDFQANENGWYTYQGKLVVATATDYLISRFGLADGVRTYRYGDEITLNIDGVDYQAVVLDSCGHAMHSGRIDLFVSGSWVVKDTIITVKE